MPRRTSTPATPAPPASLPPPPRDLLALAESDPEWADNLRALRRHWKWANFSQFFYTFAPLLAMPDVFLSDVEDDLARGTNLYVPRIMHRLLYTLSQDRKLTIDNWQTALRRQYLRRDPAANPIGPEPKVPSRESSVVPSEKEEDAEEDEGVEKDKPVEEPKPAEGSMATDSEEKPVAPVGTELSQSELSPEPKTEPKEEGKIPEENDQPKVEDEEEQESKDWLELPMLEKLDSLHLLTEWQFQNPYRVRQLMKDDDDAGNWRIEPIGYDAKTNAYWLIGPDRLWIQRVPPKPPRNRNLKRKRSAVTPKKPARAPVEASSDEEEDEPVTRSKRNRAQTASKSKTQKPANGRATRASRRAAQSPNASEIVSPGKSTRAAKVQANKKLDLQAKELAEFQRQAAALATRARANSSPRKSRTAPASPAKRAVGTRISARLRHSAKADDEGEDAGDQEWQQVPEEWLQESATPQRRTRARTRSKGKARAQSEDDEPEADAVEDAAGAMDMEDEEQRNEEVRDKGHAEGAEAGEGEGEGDAEAVGGRGDAEEDADQDDLLQKAGLESGSVSDLTDLSDQEDSEAADEGEPVTKRQRGRRSVRSKPARTTRSARRAKPAVEGSPSKSQPDAKAESDEDQEMEEPPSLPLPDDFVEWEAIAITLTEWEQVAEPFAKATHYLERALYKMLSQNIVPNVTAELMEAEKRKRIEEAIVHRKRSSRIALKESEKEEARIAAKRKAEEDEKFGRARRQEARRLKEEAEREKRERARDQRAKEREEREARARAKAERAEREETAAARSTGTPSVNGTHQSSSIQPSRVVTPNGVRTPDWVLDCEICGRRGVNVDDGKAMVSCGSCNRWQHIACHDVNDQRSGRPRRDWEKQQFYCARCRQRQLNGGAHGAHGAHGHAGHQQQQYGWGQSSGPILLHKPGGVDPYAHSADMRYAHRSPLENGMGYSQQQYLPNNVGAASYSRASYPNTGLSFNYYQPDQRGLSSRAIPTTPQGSWSSNGGYGPPTDPLAPRAGSSHFSPQYGHNGASSSMYAGGSRAPAGYPNHPPPAAVPRYDDHSAGISSSRWPSTTPNGYHSPAMREAAQSLAFMHDGSSNRYNSPGWSGSSSSYGQHLPSPATSSAQSHQSSFAHAPIGPGIDPLTGQSFSRVEQPPHAARGLPPTNGASSFNFPS